VISKLKLPQATICAAVEHWLISHDKARYRGARCISVKLKHLASGEFEAYIETRNSLAGKRIPTPVLEPPEIVSADTDNL
jgi:hypothetical protein